MIKPYVLAALILGACAHAAAPAMPSQAAAPAECSGTSPLVSSCPPDSVYYGSSDGKIGCYNAKWEWLGPPRPDPCKPAAEPSAFQSEAIWEFPDADDRADGSWTSLTGDVPINTLDDAPRFTPSFTIDLSWFTTGWYRVRGGALVKWNGRVWSIVTLRTSSGGK